MKNTKKFKKNSNMRTLTSKTYPHPAVEAKGEKSF